MRHGVERPCSRMTLNEGAKRGMNQALAIIEPLWHKLASERPNHIHTYPIDGIHTKVTAYETLIAPVIITAVVSMPGERSGSEQRVRGATP